MNTLVSNLSNDTTLLPLPSMPPLQVKNYDISQFFINASDDENQNPPASSKRKKLSLIALSGTGDGNVPPLFSFSKPPTAFTSTTLQNLYQIRSLIHISLSLPQLTVPEMPSSNPPEARPKDSHTFLGTNFAFKTNHWNHITKTQKIEKFRTKKISDPQTQILHSRPTNGIASRKHKR